MDLRNPWINFKWLSIAAFWLGGKLDEIGLWEYEIGTRVMETPGFDGV
jgi:hypothetical protein